VFAHGWLTKDGQKLSKTTGNIIDPFELVQRFGTDAVRYHFLREGAFGADLDYTEAAFVRRYNADLANDLGNLLNRTLQMVIRYFDGAVPTSDGKRQAVDGPLLDLATALRSRLETALQRFALQDVLIHLGGLVVEANKYVQETAPWELAKARKAGDECAGQRLATVLYNLVDILRLLGCCIYPVIPAKAVELLKQLGLDFDPHSSWGNVTAVGVYPAGTVVHPGQVLFPKYEA
jgi:methionyl-tRNA synthetase